MTKQAILEEQRIRQAASELGRRGGLATAARLTPKQRHARALKGGLARAAQRRRLAATKEAAHA
jgi:hypothetical protein